MPALTEEQLQLIQEVVADRLKLVPKWMLFGQEKQEMAPRRLIFELRGTADDCYFVGKGRLELPPLNGYFVYVILADDPGRIYCGIPKKIFVKSNNKAALADMADLAKNSLLGRFEIDGHSSISRRKPVVAAGELVIENGKITRWGNNSGHYQMDAIPLIGLTRRLLDPNRYTDYMTRAATNFSAGDYITTC